MSKPAQTSAKAAPRPPGQAIVLAGGAGTRLWPLSRTLFPKQLITLNGQQSMLQQTLQRVLPVFDPERVWVVTNEEHIFEVRAQVRALDPRLEAHVLAEPLARNTLPAVLLGLDSILAASGGDGGVPVAVFPSDHLVQDQEAWLKNLAQALDLARQGRFVTFGVKPRRVDSGYGFMARGEALAPGVHQVREFVEKPPLHLAEAFLRSGVHYWSSGMFFFQAKSFLKDVARFQPQLWDWWLHREEAPLTRGYRDIPAISLDYGVLEKLQDIVMVEAGFQWDDLGNWEAVYRLGDKDAYGNVLQGDVLNLDCRGCLLVSTSGKLAAMGLTDTIVVQTRDATLALPFREVQRVRDVVDHLRAENNPLTEVHPTVQRPWGRYCVLEEGPRFKIKRIVVLPGARLSQQMHHHRSEHWVVLEGTALVEIGGQERVLVENQSVDIPKTTTHRLFNPGKVPLEIIEVQSGPYLGEDDIVRYQDTYGRGG